MLAKKAYLSILSISFLFLACSGLSGDEVVVRSTRQASEAKGDAFIADTTSSKIKFTGRGVGKSHAGWFKLSSGTISIANNEITGGSFVINIKSMDLEEKGGVYDRKLYPHLMGEDFFEADKYNTAKFEITSIEPRKENAGSSAVDGANYEVSGNLTLKDVTHNISFPARIEVTDSSLSAKSDFVMNRKLWKMNYGSQKSLGDKFISEKVNIKLFLAAKPNRTPEN